MSLQSIIASMIHDAPPGSDKSLSSDLETILNSASAKKVIADNLKEYHLNSEYKLVKVTDSEYGIVSKFNQSGLKFYDPALKLKFDYDFGTFKVIDVEQDAVSVSPSLAALNKDVAQYVAQHHPTLYKGMALEDSEHVYVVIVDENLNDANFYNGKWQSFYKLAKASGELAGEISVKVHYYEDGNVVLNTGAKVSESGVSEQSLVQTIGKLEDQFELDLLRKFSSLNEDQFKNLRRQLPINRSKVQWGKAIGNYKLGQDVAGGRD